MATIDLELIEPEEAAGVLGVALNTLADWRWRGVGPDFVKIGKRVCYTRAALRRYVERQTRTPTRT